MSNTSEPMASPVTPRLRTLVYTVAMAIFVIAFTVTDSRTDISRFGILDVVTAVGSDLLVGLASGFGLPLRAAIGLLGAVPMSFLADVVLGRPDAFSATNIGTNVMSAGVMTLILPWLDPPRRLWSWASRGTSGGQRFRLGLLYAAWGLWLFAATLACAFLGYVVAELLAGPDRIASLELLGLALMVMGVGGVIWLLAGVVKRGWRANREQLVRSAVIAGCGVGVMQSILLTVIVTTARGIITPDGAAAPLIAEMVQDWKSEPWSSLGFIIVSGFVVTLAALPFVYACVVQDARALAKGRRSMLVSASILASLTVLSASIGSLLAVVTGSLVFGTGGHGQGHVLGSIVGAGIGIGAALWLIRRRPLFQPTTTWPERAPGSVPVPDAVADAVRESANRRG